MSWLRFLRRSRRDAECARELESYLAIETDDNIARGMTPGAARAAAMRKLGNPTRVREQVYDMHTISPLESLWQDLRHAFRVLMREKAFAAAAILSLTLGIGANTAIFQLLEAVRLRSLPVADAARIGRGPHCRTRQPHRQLQRPAAAVHLRDVDRAPRAAAGLLEALLLEHPPLQHLAGRPGALRRRSLRERRLLHGSSACRRSWAASSRRTTIAVAAGRSAP